MAQSISRDSELLLAFASHGKTDTALIAKPYTVEHFFDRLSKPRVGSKDGAYFIRGGDLTEPTRKTENLKSAELIILDGDSRIDRETGEIIPGAPPLDDVCTVLDSLGITYCAHTTHSYRPATDGEPALWKYRIVIPAKLPNAEALTACLDQIFTTLHKRGVWLNNVNENAKWAQLWFLPRVANENDLQNFVHRQNVTFTSYPVEKAVEYAEYIASREAAISAAIARPAPPPIAMATHNGASIIETFNKTHGLEWVRATLESKGYIFSQYVAGANHYRYLAPTSESGEAGVIVFKGKGGDWCTYSHHSAADPLSGHLTDPFRLFATFEHNGNLKSAAGWLIQIERTASLLTATRKHNAAPEPWVDDTTETVMSAEEPEPDLIEGADTSLVVAKQFILPDSGSIPPREWLYGRHLIRKYVSVTVAPGGMGKSSLLIGDALAMVTGRPIMGQSVPRPLRVWLWNLEDPYQELQRRFAAATQAHKITRQDIGDRLFVDSGRDQGLCTAIVGRDGGAEILIPVVEALVAELIRRKIDALLVDPFVSSHRVSENDNNAMDLVTKAWGLVAERANCAIALVHHARKQQDGATISADSARGGKALTDAAREVRVLNRMTKEEGEKAGVVNPRLYFRTYSDKANMSPPLEVSEWYHLQSVSLANGDEVGAVVPWVWPDAFAGISSHDLRRVQGVLHERGYRYDVQAERWAGYPIAEALGMDAHSPAGAARIKALIKGWVVAGSLAVESQTDPAVRRQVKVVVVAKWVENDAG